MSTPARRPTRPRRRQPRGGFAPAALLALLALLPAACSRDGRGLTASGTVEATEVRIASRVGGEILELAGEGSLVERGQVLARIDHGSLDLQLEQARAGLLLAEAQFRLLLKGARAEDVQQAQEALTQAQEALRVARDDAQRMKELFDSGSATRKQEEDAEARLVAARSQANSAAQALKKLQNLARPEEVQAGTARVDQARIAVQLLEKAVRDATVTSPLRGQVTRRLAEVGELASPGATLLVLSDPSRVHLTVYVAEPQLTRVKVGQPVAVRVDGRPDEPFPGTVTFISPEAEFTPKNIQTEEERVKLVFAVKIGIDNPAGILKPGMPADAVLDGAEPAPAAGGDGGTRQGRLAVTAGDGEAAGADPAVETAALSRRFGDTPALQGLDLRVPAGIMFALVGPDGAGKTTLLRLLCGLLSPSGGEARLLGLDVRRDMGRIRPRLGYLSQGFSLYGDLTVDENLEFFAEIHGVADLRRRREELLAFTRLAPFRRRLADRLSGGMKQKLALACTLIHSPALLLLDEPTTGVDPVSRRDFWLILSGLAGPRMTILLTTPYLDEAERCHRVGLLRDGRLLAVDTPAGLRSRLKGHAAGDRLQRGPAGLPPAAGRSRAAGGAALRRPGGRAAGGGRRGSAGDPGAAEDPGEAGAGRDRGAVAAPGAAPAGKRLHRAGARRGPRRNPPAPERSGS